MKNSVLKVSALLLLFFSAFSIAKAQSESGNVKVMTFNIRYDNPADGINRWELRKTKVVSLLKFFEPDIFGLQEALSHQKKYLEQELPEYESYGLGRKDGKTQGEYSPLFFRKEKFELKKSGTFWLSETPDIPGSVGWDAALERIATWAILKSRDTGSDLFILNTHFDHMGEKARLNSSELIVEKIAALAPGLPVILMGDFNVTDTSEPYKYLTGQENLLLQDAIKITALPHYGPTWSFNGFEESISPRERIDFIFTGPGIKVLKHGIISDKFDEGWPSDHFPVYAEILLGKEN